MLHEKVPFVRIERRGGDTSNLLDNLLSRMELYANNLEDLVAARTADYLTQKKRAEGTGALTIRRELSYD